MIMILLFPLVKSLIISKKNKKGKIMNNHLLKYLSTIPVVAAIWVTFTAGLIIEINRFFPDVLYFYL
jgi:photosystem I subunit IX